MAAGGRERVLVCERGVSFGYNNLVSDMRALAILRETGCPVVFDATHSVQLPGGQGTKSGGQREFVPVLGAPPSPRAWRACSWKRIRIRTRPCPTVPMPGRWRAWEHLLATLMELDAAVSATALPESALLPN